MTEKFDKFISDTYRGLVSEQGQLSQSQSKIVTDVGKRQIDKGPIEKLTASAPEKLAGKAVRRREKVNKAKLPKMVQQYDDETTSMEVA